MERKRFVDMECSVARSLEEVGEWWSLLIVRECLLGSTRFDEFQSNLGIARNVLTTRLERLQELEILERFPLEERANTFGYRLTPKGLELYPVLVALMQWGDKWTAPSGKPPIKLVDNSSGQPIEPLVVRAKGGRNLAYNQVRYEPGPGASAATRELVKRRNERVLG
ncbi:winged helix-turn-helix transcriptional regulator [Caenimonas soli]|uniref:winged helix-turn-helix transcriptional regulator n=1 Tax=Caenimonas soli TaxID=2735555 RepID=UPI0015556E8B|nr:helix-turn-helix domain-containing protein [Caenimonas soli]NPC58507.1 helix-turn-helix transcriptional regulator [Caenimonas soli]